MDFIALDLLPFIPLHFLCTHFWQLVHCNELLPTPLLQTPHGHLTAFCLTFTCSPLIITLVLFILTLMTLLSMLFSHSLSLLINSSSVSAITAKSAAYSSFHGRATTVWECVAKNDDWVKKCMEYEVKGSKARGRLKRTWTQVWKRTVKHVS